MRRRTTRFPLCLLLAALTCAGAADTQGTALEDTAALLLQPAEKRAYASAEMLLGAARAGQRLVAVGDHGVIVLSDDEGATFRQAQAVPVRATLTAVAFADAQNGWAVGHGGVILHTADGGENWTLQHSEMDDDRPLFSVYFSDAEHGVAAGLWSLLLTTADGGKNWTAVTLPPPPEGGKADRNLFALFANDKGALFIAAERGTVLRSDDGGATWSYLSTGYNGSFWVGRALKDGALIVGGLRGTIYRSVDDGRSWHAAVSGTKSSITGLAEAGDEVLAVGLDGVQLRSSDRGVTFTASQRADSLSLTALSVAGAAGVAGQDGVLLYSKRGVVAAAGANQKNSSREPQ
ncbi:MAG: glycosyl hydrolase [Zoogloeaceae bacterium]|jgi:photosystem II stability/assembly factor-like uncharacterized protein|nr:glycosyl hydrolase [Zoogloeaceae bacterium]